MNREALLRQIADDLVSKTVAEPERSVFVNNFTRILTEKFPPHEDVDALLAYAHRQDMKLMPCGHTYKYAEYAIPGSVVCILCEIDLLKQTIALCPVCTEMYYSPSCPQCHGSRDRPRDKVVSNSLTNNTVVCNHPYHRIGHAKNRS